MPIEIARDVADDIIKWGRPRHGRLGIRGQDAPQTSLPPTHSAGVLVQSDDPAGPSGVGGVKIGDVIVELNRQAIPDMGALVVDARMLEPGELATLRGWRNDQLITVTVEVGELP